MTLQEIAQQGTVVIEDSTNRLYDVAHAMYQEGRGVSVSPLTFIYVRPQFEDEPTVRLTTTIEPEYGAVALRVFVQVKDDDEAEGEMVLRDKVELTSIAGDSLYGSFQGVVFQMLNKKYHPANW
jgi:hypothetical protein